MVGHYPRRHCGYVLLLLPLLLLILLLPLPYLLRLILLLLLLSATYYFYYLLPTDSIWDLARTQPRRFLCHSDMQPAHRSSVRGSRAREVPA